MRSARRVRQSADARGSTMAATSGANAEAGPLHRKAVAMPAASAAMAGQARAAVSRAMASPQ